MKSITAIATTLGLLASTQSMAQDAPLLSLSDALSVGDCSGALAASKAQPSSHSGAVPLAIARCQVQLGQPTEALSTLGAASDTELRAYTLAIRGWALLESGEPIDAVQALQAAIEDARLAEPLRSQAHFWLAKATLQIDAGQSAQAILNKLLTKDLGAAGRLPKPGGLDPAEVRWLLADTAVREGTPEQAIPVWQAIWTRNPTSDRARQAELRLKAAGSPPGANPALMLTRIRTLEKLFRYKEALQVRESLPAGHSARGPRTIAHATFKARDYARSAQLHAALPSRNSDEELRLALAKLRSGDYAGAMAQYRVMAQAGKSTVEMATWKLGYTAYDGGHMTEALQLMGSYLQRYPAGRYAQSARWFRAMASLRDGDLPTAKTRLTELKDRHPKRRAAATYWLGRIAADTGDTALARTTYESVLRQWPSTGYAWFAAEHLNRSWPRREAVRAPGPTAALKGEAWTLGTALSDAGLQAWARPHLEGMTKKAKAAGKESALALAHRLIAAGSYRTAQALARPYCTAAHRGGEPLAQQACYPRPSGQRVSKLASTAGIPSSLPFAIMTAESALRPGVTSPAGARGLMQIMPALAAELHPQVWPERPYSEDDLYHPAYNSTLGTRELSNLHQTFGNAGVRPSLPLVIAGYNGGADAVTRWVASWPEPPAADLFAENISYTETRKYVQRVLGFLQNYRYVYGD